MHSCRDKSAFGPPGRKRADETVPSLLEVQLWTPQAGGAVTVTEESQNQSGWERPLEIIESNL